MLLNCGVGEDSLESPFDSKEVKPVNPKGNQLWAFIERTDAEAEAPKLWPLEAKCQLTGKDPDAEKDWGHEEKGVIEDEMVAWYHQFNGHEFEQTVRDSERQGNLACWSPWGHKELDMTEGLNNSRLTLFDLWTNWTYEPALRTKLIYTEGTYYSSFLFIPTLYCYRLNICHLFLH